MKKNTHAEDSAKRSFNSPAGESRSNFIAGLVHSKFGNPNFDIKKAVPDITVAEEQFFAEQFTQMARDYKSE